MSPSLASLSLSSLPRPPPCIFPSIFLTPTQSVANLASRCRCLAFPVSTTLPVFGSTVHFKMSSLLWPGQCVCVCVSVGIFNLVCLLIAVRIINWSVSSVVLHSARVRQQQQQQHVQGSVLFKTQIECVEHSVCSGDYHNHQNILVRSLPSDSISISESGHLERWRNYFKFPLLLYFDGIESN